MFMKRITRSYRCSLRANWGRQAGALSIYPSTGDIAGVCAWARWLVALSLMRHEAPLGDGSE